MDQSVALIQEAKAAVEDPSAPNKQMRLAHAAKAVSQALNQVHWLHRPLSVLTVSVSVSVLVSDSFGFSCPLLSPPGGELSAWPDRV